MLTGWSLAAWNIASSSHLLVFLPGVSTLVTWSAEQAGRWVFGSAGCCPGSQAGASNPDSRFVRRGRCWRPLITAGSSKRRKCWGTCRKELAKAIPHVGDKYKQCQVILKINENLQNFVDYLPFCYWHLVAGYAVRWELSISLFPELKSFVFSFLVPLRAPEISLTSRSPTDILISWLPIPAKYRRGQVVLYRLSFRLSTETKIQVLELPGTSDEYLLEGLRPDSVYLVRITAATRIGWGEASLWTSHRTPKATSVKGNS